MIMRSHLILTMWKRTVEDYFNPETGELMLGDIVISVDKVEEQAEKYGHSTDQGTGVFSSAQHAPSVRL